jgi:hypothetical protein
MNRFVMAALLSSGAALSSGCKLDNEDGEGSDVRTCLEQPGVTQLTVNAAPHPDDWDVAARCFVFAAVQSKVYLVDLVPAAHDLDLIVFDQGTETDKHLSAVPGESPEAAQFPALFSGEYAIGVTGRGQLPTDFTIAVSTPHVEGACETASGNPELLLGSSNGPFTVAEGATNPHCFPAVTGTEYTVAILPTVAMGNPNLVVADFGSELDSHASSNAGTATDEVVFDALRTDDYLVSVTGADGGTAEYFVDVTATAGPEACADVTDGAHILPVNGGSVADVTSGSGFGAYFCFDAISGQPFTVTLDPEVGADIDLSTAVWSGGADPHSSFTSGDVTESVTFTPAFTTAYRVRGNGLASSDFTLSVSTP